MNQQNPPAPPTEKAQIVIIYTSPQQPTVMRYNTTKKAEKEYKTVVKAWGSQSQGSLHDIDADMFIATIDLSQVACVCYVDHAKRAKFVPFQ